jgi:hypothetical protein
MLLLRQTKRSKSKVNDERVPILIHQQIFLLKVVMKNPRLVNQLKRFQQSRLLFIIKSDWDISTRRYTQSVQDTLNETVANKLALWTLHLTCGWTGIIRVGKSIL